MSYKDPGPIPNRWLNCPRKSTTLIADKFLAFKTPLGFQFNDKVPEMNRFTPAMLFDYMKALKLKIGLWVDLTNTSRFYNKSEIEQMDCQYLKLQCRGHGETPSPEQTKIFIDKVTAFISQNPLLVVGVHCTHGFNRTGFLLASYMVEQLDWSLDAALFEFAKKRDPGIYKQDYIDELYKRYDPDPDPSAIISAPPRPSWCIEEEEELDFDDDDQPGHLQTNSQPSKKNKSRRETTHKKDIFIPGVTGVEPFDTQPRLKQVQEKVQSFCKWEKTGFAGLQPVSMDMKNISYLSQKPYMVSWKADGTRYMMLIDGEDEVYMLDRDNCAFRVHGLTFLHNKTGEHLKDTLLDGEMVIDKVDGREIPRYLCYDIIRYSNINVSKSPFSSIRLTCIQNEIIRPRERAIESGQICKETEPFGVYLKEFWDVTYAPRLLEEKFITQLQHEPDGLIFQPAEEPYTPGPASDVLKWKPSELNSVDFKLKIVKEVSTGMLPVKIGYLYVGKQSEPFATMAVTKKMKHLNNKIIECSFDYKRNSWVFMRERTDKSYPNSKDTAIAVCKSIQNPVTKEYLWDYIAHRRYIKHSLPTRPYDDSDMKPPPKRPREAR